MSDPKEYKQGGGTAPWLSIVGIGEDGLAGLGEASRAAIANADHVFGGKRHLHLAKDRIKGEALSWPSPFDPDFSAIVKLRGARVCVLASGEPFFFGVGASLVRVIDPTQMLVLPAPSSFSLAAAKLGWPLQEVELLSLHARPIELLRPLLQPGRRIMALTSKASSPAQICTYLHDLGFAASRITVLEALGGPDEKISTRTVAGFDLLNINALNIIALEVAASDEAPVIPCTSGLPDGWFEHDGQISKREIRALTLSALQPRAGQLLWDIGSGSGSVAIEWMLAHPSLRAIAIERDPARAKRIARNAGSFGVPSLQVVQGAAPRALKGLPPPDVIFVGGGGSSANLMEAAMEALPSGGRLVANGVTIEMETALAVLAEKQGGALTRIALSRRSGLGSLQTFRPALPITQWAWRKP
ncbi:MAG: precorrin-6y C5,15-methyltransferase (decarboxylating) subunit CbiE [Hyphomicrobiaceae bacterium]|nr:precorrin-6y C5,15-methyltransferase (decarboxylating) subunit CbiE [Hyphomicrobiaceae bacterium]